jgi:hypothetical protein
MRRFRDGKGVEYDEIPDGRLRRRLAPEDPSRIPAPQSASEIEDKAGVLVEMSPALLAEKKGRARQ